MALGVPEDMLPAIVPITVYWIASGFYGMMMSFKKHRLFTPEEVDEGNLVTRRKVVARVLVNQSLQISLAALIFLGKIGERGEHVAGASPPPPPTSLLRILGQLAAGMLIMDAWGYFWHRWTHENRFLYKHIHSTHHRLVIPYAFGTLYQHPVDFLVADAISSGLASLATGMSARTSTVFFVLLILKAVDDHCGLWFPGSPTSRLTNNVAMHAVHHDHYGVKSNYSVYYLVTWDKLLGTYMPYSVDEREGGGYQLRSPAKDS